MRIRWTNHALQSIADRGISRHLVERVLAEPEAEAPARPPRRILMARYKDEVLAQTMLLRVIVERQPDEVVVVTVYKTSRISKYMKDY